MKTLSKKLKREQRKVTQLKKELDAAIHYAQQQKKMKAKEEIMRKGMAQTLAYVMRKTGRDELEVDMAEIGKEDPEAILFKKEGEKEKIKLKNV